MPDNLAIPATPDLLRDWEGPVEVQIGSSWLRTVVVQVDGEPCVATEDGTAPMQVEQNPRMYRLPLRRPEVRDHLLRWLAGKLGVPVGVGAPEWLYQAPCAAAPDDPGIAAGWWFGEIYLSADEEDAKMYGGLHVPSLSTVPLDSPDRDLLALLRVVEWALDQP